jgi:hypothetical protein
LEIRGMTTNPRIAIIGGGPGGLMLARLLQLGGLTPTVFERDSHPEERPQGGSLDLHAETAGQRGRRQILELQAGLGAKSASCTRSAAKYTAQRSHYSAPCGVPKHGSTCLTCGSRCRRFILVDQATKHSPTTFGTGSRVGEACRQTKARVGGADSLLRDGDMLRMNSHTTNRVRDIVRRWRTDCRIDAHSPLDTLDIEAIDSLIAKIYRWLIDPRRKLPIGLTLGGMAELAEERSNHFAFWRTAAHGGLACRHWWGTPTWPALVDRFLTTLDDQSRSRTTAHCDTCCCNTPGNWTPHQRGTSWPQASAPCATQCHHYPPCPHPTARPLMLMSGRPAQRCALTRPQQFETDAGRQRYRD